MDAAQISQSNEALRLIERDKILTQIRKVLRHAWFSDPVFFGKYPEEGLARFKDYLPEITKEDMELIAQPLDFMGQNAVHCG